MLSSGLFDAHFHIIDPRFPMVPNDGYEPEAFLVGDYLRRVEGLGVRGGAVVSGSFQGFDQSYLLNALHSLGSNFVGVTQLPADTSDAELQRLDEHGVRAVRFNVRRGGSATLDDLDRFARRVFDLLGWHVELYVDSATLESLSPVVRTLPAVSIDHLGLSGKGLRTLVSLVEAGVRVKATGFGRVDFSVPEALRVLYAANPDALMFGTDLPSTRAPRPFEDADITLIVDALGDEACEHVFWSNAARFYRLEHS